MPLLVNDPIFEGEFIDSAAVAVATDCTSVSAEIQDWASKDSLFIITIH